MSKEFFARLFEWYIDRRKQSQPKKQANGAAQKDCTTIVDI
jgi:hypothetical protein